MIDMDPVVESVCMVRASLDTRPAGDAAGGGIADLGTEQTSFGVVAPEAAQRTSFEENRCADPGTIVDRKTLNIEDESGALHPWFISKTAVCYRNKIIGECAKSNTVFSCEN
jgi:hypothetical protein